MLARARWPRSDTRARDTAALREFALVQELVGAIRAIRAEYGIAPGQTIRTSISNLSPAAKRAVAQERATIERLAKVSSLTIGSPGERVGGNAVLTDGTAVFVPLGDAIDVGRECARLGAEITRLGGLVVSQERKLANEQFVARAPAAVVETERQKLAAWREQSEVLASKRALLGCA
jgi:valyl-tRNA synthetase